MGWNKWANSKVLIFLTVVFPIFPIYSLPSILPNHPPLDLYLFYTADTAYQLIQSYGEAARAHYIQGLLTIDILYPCYYTISLMLLLRFLNNKLKAPVQPVWQWLPLAIFVFDISENLTLVYLLNQFPVKHTQLATIAGIETLIKWGCFAATVFVIAWLFYRLYQQKQANSALT